MKRRLGQNSHFSVDAILLLSMCMKRRLGQNSHFSVDAILLLSMCMKRRLGQNSHFSVDARYWVWGRDYLNVELMCKSRADVFAE